MKIKKKIFNDLNSKKLFKRGVAYTANVLQFAIPFYPTEYHFIPVILIPISKLS